MREKVGPEHHRIAHAGLRQRDSRRRSADARASGIRPSTTRSPPSGRHRPQQARAPSSKPRRWRTAPTGPASVTSTQTRAPASSSLSAPTRRGRPRPRRRAPYAHRPMRHAADDRVAHHGARADHGAVEQHAALDAGAGADDRARARPSYRRRAPRPSADLRARQHQRLARRAGQGRGGEPAEHQVARRRARTPPACRRRASTPGRRSPSTSAPAREQPGERLALDRDRPARGDRVDHPTAEHVAAGVDPVGDRLRRLLQERGDPAVGVGRHAAERPRVVDLGQVQASRRRRGDGAPRPARPGRGRTGCRR